MNKSTTKHLLKLSDCELRKINLQGLIKHRDIATEWSNGTYDLVTYWVAQGDRFLTSNPEWSDNMNYSIIIRTRLINPPDEGLEMPIPLSGSIKIGTAVWGIDFSQDGGVYSFEYSYNFTNGMKLDRGSLFATQKEALAAASVLMEILKC